jgi:hypothetical protein
MESNRELKVTRNISGCQLTIRDERRRTDRPDVRSNDLSGGSLSFRFNVTARGFTRNHDRSAVRASEGGHG